MDNLDNGLELLSGKLVVLFLTYALALEACANFPAGTRLKVTNDPNPDLNGEYTWDGKKLVKTTNNTLEKAKDEAEKLVDDKLETVLTPDKILDIISGQITEGDLDTHLRQRIDKIESVGPIIDELQREADKVKKDLDEQLFFLEVDYNNLKKYVTELELEVNIDFAGVKDQIQQLRDQVAADMAAAQKRIDEIQAEIDTKWQEVDQIQLDLQKEINDRIDAVRAETEARVAEIRKLNDGLTQEIIDRKDGDQKLYENIENYKVSNEQSLANIREEVKVAVDTANASAEKVDALDARVKVAEDNSGKALENSAAAVSKAQAAADLAGATATRVDSLEADVVKAVDDSGTAIKNSATALQQSQAAVDKANAVAESVNIVEAKLNTKNSTYRQDTAPTKADTPNLTAGDIWINPSNKNEQKRWNGVAWVDISDMRIGDNASAIEKLTATVSDQGGQIKANADKITNLETTIGDMATSDALEALRTEVKKNTDGISGNAEKITALETTVGKNQEANSKALQDLNTRVDKTDEKVASNASAITSLNSTVNASLSAVNITADLDLDHDVTYFRKFGEIDKVSADEGTTQRVIRVGNNAGNDVLWMHPNTFMPFDPDVMYKVRAKVRRNSGTGTIYIGVAAKNAVKTKYVKTTNTLADDMGSSHYFLSGSTASTTPVGQWVELEWYIKGRSTGSSLLPPTYGVIDKPIQLAKYVGYITPMFIANYGNAAGQVDVAYVVLETAEAYKMISANANALTSLKTDVQKNADGIKAVGEAVTNVESSITNMDIGGQNLWSIWNKTLTQPVTGGPYIKVDWLEGQENDEWYRATIIKDMTNYQHYFINVLVDQKYPIVIGEEYTVTFEMRASKVAKIYQVLAYFGALSTVVDNKQSTTTDWKTYTFTAKANGTNTTGSYQLFGFTLLKSEGWNLNDWYEVRRVQLQKGNKATRYQKAQAGLLAGIKANSQAFSSLNATVQEHADTISSQGQAITGLESKVNGIDGEFKANAKAVDELKTTVIEQGDEIRSQGQAITSLDNTVKISAKGGTNLLINSNVVGLYDGKYPHLVYTLGEDWEVGTQYTLIWCGEHSRGTGDTNSYLAVYAGGGSQQLQSMVNTGGKKVSTVTFIKNSRTYSKTLNFYVVGQPKPEVGTVGTVYWAVLVKGPSALTDVWIPSPYDYIPQATANANAITALQTDVKTNGDNIKIQAEQLTGVKSTLNAVGSDNLVLDYNVETPSAWESYYGYDVKQYFKKTASGKTGPTVFRKDTTNPPNCFNFNLSKLPNTRPYKVSFWVRRSADSTGRFEIPVRYVRADGSVSNVGGGYGTYPITPAIPNNEVWTFVEMVIDVSKVADAPQIQFGIALGHTGTTGWSEMQAFKVSSVLTKGDVDDTIASTEAVQKLSTQVDKNTKGIETQGQAITGLESKVNDLNKSVGGQATAIDELKTSVKTQGDTITAQGQSITKVEARIDGLSTGNLNLISKSKWMLPAMDRVNQKDNYSFTLVDKSANTSNMYVDDWARFGIFSEFTVGTQYVFSFKVKVNDATKTNIGGRINGFTVNAVSLDGKVVQGALYASGTAVFIPNDNQFHTFTVLATRTGADTGIYIQPNRITNYTTPYDVTIKEVMLTEGNIQTGWTAPPDYFGDQIAASASAITGLTTDVSKIDGLVQAQARDITNLKASVDGIEKGKADVSALDSLRVDVKSNADNIKLQADKVTGLETNLDNVRLATGQNLIWNGDFTSKPNPLLNWASNSTAGKFESYVWTALGTIWGRYYSTDTTTAFKGMLQVVPLSRGLKPNMTYTLSFLAHGNQGSVGKNIGVIIHRSTPAGNNQVSGGPFVTPAGIQRHSFTFNTNNLNDLTHLNVIFYAHTGYAPDFFITEVQLEEGSVATGYRKSNSEMLTGISANASAITQLKTDVETNGESIKAQSKQITDLSVRVNNMDHDNLLVDFRDAEGSGASYEQLSVKLKEPIVIRTGEKYTVRGKLSFEHPNVLPAGAGLRIYLEGSPYFVSLGEFKQGNDQTFEGSLTVDSYTNGRTISNLKIYLFPSGTGVATTKTTLHWAELFKGDSILGGTAQAVQSLNATVTQQGKDIKSNSDAITKLDSSVTTLEKGKADASALNNYYTKAEADKAVAGQLTEVTSRIDGIDQLARLTPNSKKLYEDVNFKNGTSSVVVYDNANTGRVKVTRVAKEPDNPTTSGYQLNITVTNGANPWYGGFLQSIPSRANAVFLIKYLLKLPVGYKLVPARNAIGTGGEGDRFIGSVEGTGRYETYTRVVKCGTTAPFSNSGHVSVQGTALSGTQTMTFPLAQIEAYDVTDYAPADSSVLRELAANTDGLAKLEVRTKSTEDGIETLGTDVRALQSKVNDPVKGIDATAIAMGKLDTRVKTTEDSIVAQGKSITQVEADLKNITAGGSNLLRNGNFASTPDLANWRNWGGTNATRSVTTISGKKWVRITANNTLKFRGISQSTPANSFKRGVQYTITFTAQSVGATGGVQLIIHQAGDGSNDPQITPAVFPITNVAKRISHTFTSSTAAKTAFNVMIGPQNGVAGDIYLTDIMFTEGNIATAWSPSNDEINDGLSANAKAVSDLSVEVGKVDGRVTTVAKSVTTLEGTVGDNSAALETQGLVIDGLKVRWSVKADVNGMVSGVAMNNDGKTADFIIRANTFAIAPPTNANAGDVGKYAFVYKSTPQTLPNGTVIPAGLYVDSLMLGEIKAERINAQSISAISANLGTFETSVTGKGKTVISGTQYQVFDAAGVERIFLGVR